MLIGDSLSHVVIEPGIMMNVTLKDLNIQQ